MRSKDTEKKGTKPPLPNTVIRKLQNIRKILGRLIGKWRVRTPKGEDYGICFINVFTRRSQVERLVLDPEFNSRIPREGLSYSRDGSVNTHRSLMNALMIAKELCAYIDDLLEIQLNVPTERERRIRVEVYRNAFYVENICIIPKKSRAEIKQLHYLANKFEKDRNKGISPELYQFTLASIMARGDESFEPNTVRRRLKRLQTHIVKAHDEKIPKLTANDVIEYEKYKGFRFNPHEVFLIYKKELTDRPTNPI